MSSMDTQKGWQREKNEYSYGPDDFINVCRAACKNRPLRQRIRNIDTDELYDIPNPDLREWLEEVIIFMHLRPTDIEDIYLRLCDIETRDEYAISFVKMRTYFHIWMTWILQWTGVSLEKQGDGLVETWDALEEKQKTTRVLQMIMKDIVQRECYNL